LVVCQACRPFFLNLSDSRIFAIRLRHNPVGGGMKMATGGEKIGIDPLTLMKSQRNPVFIMRLHLALDPRLDLSASDLATAWNGGEFAAEAQASVEPSTAATFLSSEMTILLLSAAVSIPASVISTFISDYLKRKFPGKKPPAVEVTTITTPDGEPLFIIRKEIEQPEP